MPVFIAIIYAVLMFAFQTLLFRKTSNLILHLIPVMVIGLVYLTALFLPLADKIMTELGRNYGYSFYSFTALLIAGVNTLGLAADGAAWLFEKV